MRKYNIDNPEDSAVCLECGDSFTLRRSNMKFCCEQCRYDYYNRLNAGSSYARVRCLNQLGKNYEILKSLLANGVKEMTLSELSALGFKTGSVTSFAKARRHLELCIYDIRFKQSESRIYDIGKVSLNLRRAAKKSRQ